MSEALDSRTTSADAVIQIASASGRSFAARSRPVPDVPAEETAQDKEFEALRRDLDLQREYVRHLEAASVETRDHVRWLQTTLDQERALRAAASVRTTDLEQRLVVAEAELAAERVRASYLLAARVLVALRRHRVLYAVLRRTLRGRTLG